MKKNEYNNFKDVNINDQNQIKIYRKHKKLTNWKNEPDVKKFQDAYKESDTVQSLLKERIDEWEQIRDGGPELDPEKFKGRSKYRSKIVRQQAEYKYSNLSDPILSDSDMFKAIPRSGNDPQKARKNSLLLNYQWQAQVKRVSFVDDFVRTLVNEGRSIVKTGWDYEASFEEVETEEPIYASPDEAIEILEKGIENQEITPDEADAVLNSGQLLVIGSKKVKRKIEKVLKNQPKYTVCNNRTTRIDPNCNGYMDDASFVIDEYPITWAELKKKEHRIETLIDFDENGIEVKVKKEYGIYKNLNVIEHVDDNEYIADENDDESKQNYKTQDKFKRVYRAKDYWGYCDINNDGIVVPIVATWIGETLVRLERNPFPHQKLPFSLCRYMPKVNEAWGETDAEITKDDQDIISKNMRFALDTNAKTIAGREIISDNLFLTPMDKRNYENGKTAYARPGVDPRSAIYKETAEGIGRAPMDMISIATSNAKEMTGHLSFGASQNLGSASMDRAALSASAKRDLSILRRIGECFADIGQKTLAMNQAFIPEEVQVRITDEYYEPVSPDDITGEYDLTVELSTPEEKLEKAEKLNMMLQTNAASMEPDESRMVRAEIARLWGLKELEYFQRTYEKEEKIDPKAQQLQEIQIQNALLEQSKLKKEIEEMDSRIHERISRTLENEVDVENKKAQTRERNAKADLIEAQRDEVDQRFLDREDGKDLNREIVKEDIKAKIGSQKKNEEIIVNSQIDNEKIEMQREIEMLRQQLAQMQGNQNIEPNNGGNL